MPVLHSGRSHRGQIGVSRPGSGSLRLPWALSAGKAPWTLCASWKGEREEPELEGKACILIRGTLGTFPPLSGV